MLFWLISHLLPLTFSRAILHPKGSGVYGGALVIARIPLLKQHFKSTSGRGMLLGIGCNPVDSTTTLRTKPVTQLLSMAYDR